MGLFSSPTLYFKKKNERCYIKLTYLQFLVHVLSIIINVHVHKKIILLCLLCGTLHTLIKNGLRLSFHLLDLQLRLSV